MTMKHRFVDIIPDELEEGVLFISTEFCTAVHKCCCGCGNEVVTPLSPTDWELVFNGDSVSLSPSIGNWGFECKSHYWIKKSQVQWAGKWTEEEIRAGRHYAAVEKAKYFQEQDEAPQEFNGHGAKRLKGSGLRKKKGIWSHIKLWWSEMWI